VLLLEGFGGLTGESPWPPFTKGEEVKRGVGGVLLLEGFGGLTGESPWPPFTKGERGE
jgi:hypothetical protein